MWDAGERVGAAGGLCRPDKVVMPTSRRDSRDRLERHYAGKRILVTGGLGFIGSHLVRTLGSLRAEVLAFDLRDPGRYPGATTAPGVSVEVADVRDELIVGRSVADRDIVFHLAGQTSHVDSMNDPYADLEQNCAATLSLLEALRRQRSSATVVYTGTRQIYGRPQYLPVDEQHPVKPLDINGVHKAAAESYLAVYSRAYGVRTCVVRLTNTYGEGMALDDRQSFLGHWLGQLVAGREIEVYGDGTRRRDFTYVDDVVHALLLAGASERAQGQVYNLGGGGTLTLREVAELLIVVHGSGSYQLVPFPPERLPIDIGDYEADYTKIQAALGWRPRVPLPEGVKRTLRFAKEQRDQP